MSVSELQPQSLSGERENSILDRPVLMRTGAFTVLHDCLPRQRSKSRCQAPETRLIIKPVTVPRAHASYPRGQLKKRRDLTQISRLLRRTSMSQKATFMHAYPNLHAQIMPKLKEHRTRCNRRAAQPPGGRQVGVNDGGAGGPHHLKSTHLHPPPSETEFSEYNRANLLLIKNCATLVFA